MSTVMNGNGVRSAELSAVVIPADTTFRDAMLTGLVWLPELGMGYSGQALRADSIYDYDYWASYQDRASSPIAHALNEGRRDMVARHIGTDLLVDVGIGAGTFIETRGFRTTRGFDINPHGIAWLERHSIWCDPYAGPFDNVSLWDALEHVHAPAALLANVRRFAFVSIPIFTDARDVLASKHYKPNEHIWYWTRDGLIRWMGKQGFTCVEHGTPESLIGREDIHSFVFRRHQ